MQRTLHEAVWTNLQCAGLKICPAGQLLANLNVSFHILGQLFYDLLHFCDQWNSLPLTSLHSQKILFCQGWTFCGLFPEIKVRFYKIVCTHMHHLNFFFQERGNVCRFSSFQGKKSLLALGFLFRGVESNLDFNTSLSRILSGLWDETDTFSVALESSF